MDEVWIAGMVEKLRRSFYEDKSEGLAKAVTEIYNAGVYRAARAVEQVLKTTEKQKIKIDKSIERTLTKGG